MPNSLSQIQTDIDQFIARDFRIGEQLLERLYEAKKFTEKDYLEGIQHLKRRQDIVGSKEEEAQIQFALALFKLFSPSGDERTTAIQHVETAIQQSNPLAMFVMGYCYQHGIVVAKDPAKAIVLYRQAVAGRSAAAARNLGYCYQQGIGVAKNPVEAVKFYQQAVAGGNAAAACNLGYCYQQGIGVAKDPVEAVKFYQQAVAGGNAAAANNLGYCYQYGIGVAKDPAKAVELYQQAVDGRADATATYNLGLCYRRGIGVTKNPAKALMLYQQAVDDGDALAAFNLGLCYHQGTDVAKDLVKAINLYITAINKTNSSEVFDVTLKDLDFCLRDLCRLDPSFAQIDLPTLAQCCAKASKRFPQSEGCRIAKQILPYIARQTNNFEVHYWATLATPVWGAAAYNFFKFQTPIGELIKSDPDAFVNCLLKDDVHTLEEKEKTYNDHSQLFSTKNTYLIFDALKLREERSNPNSFFKLLPVDIYDNLAKNITSKPAEATRPIPAPRPHR